MSTFSGAPRLSDCCYHPSYCQPNYCPPKKCGGTLVTAHVVRWKFDKKCCRVVFKDCESTCIFVHCEHEQNVVSAIMAQYILNKGKRLNKGNGAGDGDDECKKLKELLVNAKNGLLQVVITDRTCVTPPCAPPVECTEDEGDEEDEEVQKTRRTRRTRRETEGTEGTED